MLTATVCIALSGAGLALALLTAWKRRFLRATRIAAWSLLPVGLYLTGLLPLGQKIGKAVGTWAADLVFKPTVWAGVAVLALSVVLFAVTRVAGRRAAARSAPQAGAGGAPPVASRASAAALGPGRATSLGADAGGGRPEGAAQPARAGKPGKRKGDADSGLSDFKEIEDILRRHGI